ncbi:MAG: hypothetical protein RLZZ71_2092 [Bacteroidota bacterium]|jgi:hypothetical protein
MTKKIIIISVLAILAIGGGIGYYLWNKPKTNAAELIPDYILPADSLAAAFAKDEDAANKKYTQDSIKIEVQGIVDSVYTNEGNETLIILATSIPDYSVNCSFLPEDKVSANKGDKVVIKGFCSGYQLMDGVQMTKCARMK